MWELKCTQNVCVFRKLDMISNTHEMSIHPTLREKDICMGMWPPSVRGGLCGSLSPVLREWWEWVTEHWWQSGRSKRIYFFQNQVPAHHCGKGAVKLGLLAHSTHGLPISESFIPIGHSTSFLCCSVCPFSLTVFFASLPLSLSLSLSLSHSVGGFSLLVLWRSHLHMEHQDHSSVKHQSCSRRWTGVPLSITTYYSYINAGFQQQPPHTNCTLPYAHATAEPHVRSQNICKKMCLLRTRACRILDREVVS